MSDSLPNLNIAQLNLDPTCLKAIEQLLDLSLSRIDPQTQAEAIADLSQLQNQIVQLKNKKGNLNSKKLHVGVSELRQAFHTHRGAADKTQGISSHLLLFYAAECGLKSIWLKQKKLRTTEQILDPTLLSKDGRITRSRPFVNQALSSPA